MKQRLQRLRSILLALSLLGIITLLMLANPRGTNAAQTGQIKEITISARAFEYTPRTVYVQKGDRVRITLIAEEDIVELVRSGKIVMARALETT